MVIGQIVLGLGGANLNIGQNILCYNWFYMKNFNLSLNILMSSNIAMSVLNQYISPRLYKSTQSIE